MMIRRIAAAAAAVALLGATAACQHDKPNGGASNPPAIAKPTWNAAPEGDKNPSQAEVTELPPPLPKDDCSSEESPVPSGLEISFGKITGALYSGCRFPEAPISYTVTLSIHVKLPDGEFYEVASQDFHEIPVWLPEKSPYFVYADCVPGIYILRVKVEGLGSNGKPFRAALDTGQEFYVHEEDCP